MLTDQQRLYFDTFGFLVRRQVFTPQEMAVIGQRFDEVMDEDRRGTDFSGDKHQGVIGFVERKAELRGLVDDDRIYNAVEDLLGPGFVWIGSDGNLYVGSTEWHPDGGEPYKRLKVALYLDPVEKDTGCLRVIPGSHRGVVHDRLKHQRPAAAADVSPYGVGGSEIPSFPLESKPGDVVCFDYGTLHASYGGKAGRRMFTMCFASEPTSDVHFDILRADHEANRRSFIPQHQVTQNGRVHDDAFLNSESPRIRRLVAYLVERGLT